MEKRFFLALLLTGAVVVLTPMVFPRSRSNAPTAVVDSAAAAAAQPAARDGAPAAAMSSGKGAIVSPALAAAPPGQAAETLVVRTALSAYTFSGLGAAPLQVQADSFPALNGSKGRVVLRHGREPLLRFRVVMAGDTIPLDQMVFAAAKAQGSDGAPQVTFTASRGATLVTIVYRFTPDNYVATTSVQVTGLSGPAFLLVDLPTGFDTQEADSLDDIRHLSYAVKPLAQGARGIPFTKLDEGESTLEPGPLSWAVAKNKYFLVGMLAPTGGKPFAEAHVVGGARTRKLATRGAATVVLALDNGKAAFELYAGPQSWERLHKIGREFETANPYGGFMQPVVQPFATIVMRVLLWMKKTVRLDYGFVLVIFGVVVRLLLWPLNQSAMRTSIRMQRIQPELQEIQGKHKSDPQKQQAEIMRVYKEHGMSPFSAFSGCLPMLIPMPVLFALFFVFQNTIEFRGVPFLWLQDISMHDPLYALPLLMGASAFALSWIGMRNSPPNPQAKMMSYIFPVMMTFIFLNQAAGLNLYYAVQNLAALPQQWLIANERARSQKKG
jgi:YidC/Oxa1 family membrane protein insertase